MFSVYGSRAQHPYSLTRNQSDGQILKQRQFANKEEKLPLISTRDFLQVNTILCNSLKNINVFGCSGQS